tara:strand:- start:515 stop:766 length:252 start_codon:yes stop_codon:yes gene_type:complete
MKYHKEVKLEGFSKAEIIKTLESNGLKFRRMRQENSWVEKLELQDNWDLRKKIQFLIQDDLLELRGNHYPITAYARDLPKFFK